MLQVENVSVCIGKKQIVRDVSFALQPGQWLMLAGPNGAGKSTLIRAIARSVPHAGRILLDGRDVRSLRPAEMARRVGVLPQLHRISCDYTVEDVVRLGRYAHRSGLFSSGAPDDERCISEALALTGMTAMRHQSLQTLSGGEVQRAFLAQVFAQQPRLLMLDEPANHLDLKYQQHIFALIQSWLAQPGRAVLSVVHDLSLARRYGTHAVLLSDGACLAQGRMEDVLTREYLRAAYGMDVHQWMGELLAQWQDAP